MVQNTKLFRRNRVLFLKRNTLVQVVFPLAAFTPGAPGILPRASGTHAEKLGSRGTAEIPRMTRARLRKRSSVQVAAWKMLKLADGFFLK